MFRESIDVCEVENTYVLAGVEEVQKKSKKQEVDVLEHRCIRLSSPPFSLSLTYQRLDLCVEVRNGVFVPRRKERRTDVANNESFKKCVKV